ncbi:MAG TPA: ATP-binding protein [Pyrinomonadaceae bacterium]|nr:ATP-binding protein [Pyrinomonadaceae bacterium]
MTSLESYLRGTYKEDGAFLNRLLNTIDEVIPLFYKQKHEKLLEKGETTWPYAVSKGLKQRGEKLSSSTHGMILFALDALSPRGKNKYSILLGKDFRPCKLSGRITDRKKLQEVIVAAKRTLVTKVNENAAKGHLVKSGTYGDDDPFTLTWLAEIAFRWTEQPDVEKEELDEFRNKICDAAVQAALKRTSILKTTGSGDTFTEVDSAFLEVRRLHLARAIERLATGNNLKDVRDWLEDKSPELWKNFDATIHRQLSYSEMGDPKFDPSELAFAFEGALLLHPTWVGNYTIDTVFEALKLSRNRHPYWRPITPFLANERGHVLFLISIEVANSILRACEILDEGDARPTRFSQFEPQLRDYATWMLGEVEEISDHNPDEPNFVGWRTEYEEKRDTIQLWHTSHVLVFMAQYASLLKRKIAADGVEAAGLQVRRPEEIKEFKGYWDDEPLPSLKDTHEQHYAVLERIKRHYIEPRQKTGKGRTTSQTTPLYSMLLYGPPGTGKTTVAEQLAVVLKQPLIIVTVSDFLAAGAAEIENRAKGVFEVLRAQEEVVILFDEIDQFLLDRNSDFYQEQDDVFKFMTPGMLTKLQNLRDAENCIFVVATNYYERIDSAIKRRGRIDEHFLLCIPDKQQRLRVLERFTLSLFERKLKEEGARATYKEASKDDEARRYFFEVISGFSLLRMEDIKNPAGLAAKLLGRADSLSQYLLDQFSAEAKQLLAQHASSGSPSEELQRTLVDELNKLIEGASLFEEKRFAGVDLEPGTRKLVEQPLKGEELVRLNRTLLVEAYPDEIAKVSKGFKKESFEAALNKIPTATVLFGWGDLKNLVESRTKVKEGMNLESYALALLDARKGLDAAVALSAYRNRFKGNGPFPFEEFFLLLYLVAEANEDDEANKADEWFTDSDKETIKQLLDKIPHSKGDIFEYLKKEKAIREDKVSEKVQKYMKDLLTGKAGENDKPNESR